jgi:hypothetical protein
VVVVNGMMNRKMVFLPIYLGNIIKTILMGMNQMDLRRGGKVASEGEVLSTATAAAVLVQTTILVPMDLDTASQWGMSCHVPRIQLFAQHQMLLQLHMLLVVLMEVEVFLLAMEVNMI